MEWLGLSVAGIENLPCELQRNFQLMRELDQRTEGGCRCAGVVPVGWGRRGGGVSPPDPAAAVVSFP